MERFYTCRGVLAFKIATFVASGFLGLVIEVGKTQLPGNDSCWMGRGEPMRAQVIKTWKSWQITAPGGILHPKKIPEALDNGQPFDFSAQTRFYVLRILNQGSPQLSCLGIITYISTYRNLHVSRFCGPKEPTNRLFVCRLCPTLCFLSTRTDPGVVGGMQ